MEVRAPEAEVTKALWRFVPPVLLTFGTFGNVMTGVVLRRMRLQRSASAMPVFLTALAVSDTCLLYTGLLRLWVNHLFLLDLKALSRGWCKVLTWMTYSSVMVSAWVLMFMTVERSVSVWTPHKVSLLCSKFTALVIVLLVTIGALLVNAHLLYGLDLVEKKMEGGGTGQENKGGGSSQSNQTALQNVTPGRGYHRHHDFQDTRSSELMVPEECRSCRNLTTHRPHGSLSSSQTFLITFSSSRRTAGADSSNGISLLDSARPSAADKIDQPEVANLHVSSPRYYALNASSSWTLQKDDSPAITTASSAAGTSFASDDVADMECSIPDPRYKDFFDGDWTWLDLTLSSALPFLVLLSGNCLIVIKVRRQPHYWVCMATSESRRLGSVGSRDVARRRKTASSMTLILVTLSIVFFVTTLPVCVFNVTEIHILNAMGRDPLTMSKLDLAWVVVNLLMYSNSALNFYLYCLTGHKFRAEFLLLVRGCLPCPPRPLPASTRAAASAAAAGTLTPRPHAPANGSRADLRKGSAVAASVSMAGAPNGRCYDRRLPSVLQRQKTIGYDPRANSVALNLGRQNQSLQQLQEGGTVSVLRIARLASPE